VQDSPKAVFFLEPLRGEGAREKIKVQIRLSAFTLPQGEIEKFEKD